jgi:hypothetical protein
VPETAALTYGGKLEDAAGKPLKGSHNLQLIMWRSQEMSGGPACQTRSTAVDLRASGHFSLELPGDCSEAQP